MRQHLLRHPHRPSRPRLRLPLRRQTDGTTLSKWWHGRLSRLVPLRLVPPREATATATDPRRLPQTAAPSTMRSWIFVISKIAKTALPRHAQPLEAITTTTTTMLIAHRHPLPTADPWMTRSSTFGISRTARTVLRPLVLLQAVTTTIMPTGHHPLLPTDDRWTLKSSTFAMCSWRDKTVLLRHARLLGVTTITMPTDLPLPLLSVRKSWNMADRRSGVALERYGIS